MSLSNKYSQLVTLAERLGGTEVRSLEEAGKFKLWATVPHPLERDLMWDAIKAFDNWEAEVEADIRSAQTPKPS